VIKSNIFSIDLINCFCYSIIISENAKSVKAGDAKPGVYSRISKLCWPGSPGFLAREKAKPVKTGDAKPKDLEPTGKQHWVPSNQALESLTRY
jgi:hypothetical protein